MKRNYLIGKEQGLALWNSTMKALFGLMVLFMGYHSQAQGQVITGRIVDSETNETIPGATILVKGTQNGAISDMDGIFRLELQPGQEEVLVISFVGYKTAEVPVVGKSTVEVSLMMDVEALEEVVVVGYGTQKKALNTGANLQVSGDDIQKLTQKVFGQELLKPEHRDELLEEFTGGQTNLDNCLF